MQLEIPGQSAFDSAAALIEGMARSGGGKFPDEASANAKLEGLRDPFGSPVRYEILNSTRVRLISDGPDRKPGTRWDTGMILEMLTPLAPKTASWSDRLHPSKTWLERRKEELRMNESAWVDATDSDSIRFTRSGFCGGQTRLRGAAYFRFFTWLMLGTAVAFIPYAILYRPKTYLQN